MERLTEWSWSTKGITAVYAKCVEPLNMIIMQGKEGIELERRGTSHTEQGPRSFYSKAGRIRT